MPPRSIVPGSLRGARPTWTALSGRTSSLAPALVPLEHHSTCHSNIPLPAPALDSQVGPNPDISQNPQSFWKLSFRPHEGAGGTSVVRKLAMPADPAYRVSDNTHAQPQLPNSHHRSSPPLSPRPETGNARWAPPTSPVRPPTAPPTAVSRPAPRPQAIA